MGVDVLTRIERGEKALVNEEVQKHGVDLQYVEFPRRQHLNERIVVINASLSSGGHEVEVDVVIGGSERAADPVVVGCKRIAGGVRNEWVEACFDGNWNSISVDQVTKAE